MQGLFCVVAKSITDAQILQAVGAFLWAFLAVPLSMALAKRFRLLDVPGGRKLHASVTPRGAGIVLWVGFLLVSLLMGDRVPFAPYVASGATGVFVVGYLDDMSPLPPSIRFMVHLVAAMGVLYPLDMPLLHRVVAVIWITGLTNAFNLIDGMDGLCLSMTLVTMGCAMYFLSPFPWVVTMGLVLGVMLWNFPKAKTFLGDGGSTLLGFLCGSLMLWDAGEILAKFGVFRLCVTLFLLGGLPVVDTLSVMFGRILRGASPFLPDRTHGHHRLLDMGLGKIKVLAVLVCVHLSLVVAGMLLLIGGARC